MRSPGPPAATGWRSASNDHTVSLWDTTQLDQGHVARLASLRGQPIRCAASPFIPTAPCWPRGAPIRQFACGGCGMARHRVSWPRAHKVSALAFAPHGQWLLTGNYSPPRPGQLTLLTYPQGRCSGPSPAMTIWSSPPPFIPAGTGWPAAAAMTKPFCSGMCTAGQVLSRLASQGQTITAVGFARDGQMISWGHTTRYTSINDRGPLDQQFDLGASSVCRGACPHARPARPDAGRQVELTHEQGGPNMTMRIASTCAVAAHASARSSGQHHGLPP